jgi:hypothetical protein
MQTGKNSFHSFRKIAASALNIYRLFKQASHFTVDNYYNDSTFCSTAQYSTVEEVGNLQIFGRWLANSPAELAGRLLPFEQLPTVYIY